jgi:hypothetical protein
MKRSWLDQDPSVCWHPANMLWVSIGGKVYVIKFDHASKQIQICDWTQTGVVLHSLDDSTPVSAIETIFRAL